MSIQTGDIYRFRNLRNFSYHFLILAPTILGFHKIKEFENFKIYIITDKFDQCLPGSGYDSDLKSTFINRTTIENYCIRIA